MENRYYQKTIKNVLNIKSIGLHSGKIINMTLKPNDCGIIFKRSDLNKTIELNVENIIDTTLATTLGNKEFSISTIEHLLSALYIYGIDSVIIEVDGPEVPIMDGSAYPFCMMIEESGIQYLNDLKDIIVIEKSTIIKDSNKFVKLEPSEHPIFDYEIDFENIVIGREKYIFNLSFENYLKNIARARTFGLLKEVNYLRSRGLIQGGSLDNAIVVDDNKILNSEGLRFEKEFVKHKILDAIGDLKILNKPILGKYSAYMGSHSLNYKLSKEIVSSKPFSLVRLKDINPNIQLNLAYSY